MLEQHIGIARFIHEPVRPRSKRRPRIWSLTLRAQREHGNPGSATVGLQLLDRLETIDDRHPEVHEYQIGRGGERLRHRLVAV